MIDYTLDQTNSVLHVRPTVPLQEKDFVAATIKHFPFRHLEEAKTWVAST
jgi:hypothetical protein